MHELGIVYHVAKTVMEFAEKNNVTKVDTVVLQVGELSSVVPRYLEACYPVAVDGTMLEGTRLKIEIVPAKAVCRQCGGEFLLRTTGNTCPACQCQQYGITSGREFIIKEIVAC